VLNSALGLGAAQPGRVSTLPGADRSDLPYVPVMTPPEIVRIWIYDHVTPSNDLVVGHWVFIKLRDQKWYIEEQWDDGYKVPRKGWTGPEGGRALIPSPPEGSSATVPVVRPPEQPVPKATTPAPK